MGLIFLLVCIAVTIACFLGDHYLSRHPLKKLDARTEKYRYRGF